MKSRLPNYTLHETFGASETVIKHAGTLNLEQARELIKLDFNVYEVFLFVVPGESVGAE